MMLASASGVSTTRSAPKRSTSPLVVRKTPPSRPTSRPSTMTRGSRSISSARALLIASTMLRWGTSVSLPVEQLGALLQDALGRMLVDVGEEVRGAGSSRGAGELQRRLVFLTHLFGHFRLALLIPHAEARETPLDSLDPLPRSRPLLLLRGLVLRRVVAGVRGAHS